MLGSRTSAAAKKGWSIAQARELGSRLTSEITKPFICRPPFTLDYLDNNELDIPHCEYSKNKFEKLSETFSEKGEQVIMCNHWCIEVANSLLDNIPVGVRILEVGSRNVNGSVRKVLEPKSINYVGVDLFEGNGVDIVLDVANLRDQFGDDKFDVYDVATDKWSIGVLPVGVLRASIISVNNTIYLAGGVVNGILSDKVWKMEF